MAAPGTRGDGSPQVRPANCSRRLPPTSTTDAPIWIEHLGWPSKRARCPGAAARRAFGYGAANPPGRGAAGPAGGAGAHTALVGKPSRAGGGVGHIDWLITSARLVGRAPGNGELISIWWAGLAGMQVDLDAEVISLDAANDWRGQLSGPGVTPVAVAAVAGSHGTAGLADHLALAVLRDRVGLASALRLEPPAVGLGGPVLKLWSSGPNE